MVDAIDLQILERLQQRPMTTEDAPAKATLITHAEIARQINAMPPPEHRVSEATVTRRIAALERSGVIKHYAVELDAEQLGLDYAAYLRVYFRSYKTEQLETFYEKIVELPYVQGVSIVTGERTDVVLRIITTNSKSYYEIMQKIHGLAGVSARVETSQILKDIKRTTALPLTHLHDAPVTPHRQTRTRKTKTATIANDTQPPSITSAEIS